MRRIKVEYLNVMWLKHWMLNSNMKYISNLTAGLSAEENRQKSTPYIYWWTAFKNYVKRFSVFYYSSKSGARCRRRMPRYLFVCDDCTSFLLAEKCCVFKRSSSLNGNNYIIWVIKNQKDVMSELKIFRFKKILNPFFWSYGTKQSTSI